MTGKKQYIDWKYGKNNPLEILRDLKPILPKQSFKYWKEDFSQNPNITKEFILPFSDFKLDWYWLSQNPNITVSDILAYPKKRWNWDGVS
jgi:hypothetical protein